MLYISFELKDSTIFDIDGYFDISYDDEWFDDDLVKRMVQDIDNSEVLSKDCIKSPVLGQIPPTKISGGVKALILLLKEPELEIYATACGDNCAKWIIEISKRHDIKIVLNHVMHFNCDFDAICVDNGKYICSLNDYRRCLIACL